MIFCEFFQFLNEKTDDGQMVRFKNEVNLIRFLRAMEYRMLTKQQQQHYHDFHHHHHHHSRRRDDEDVDTFFFDCDIICPPPLCSRQSLANVIAIL
jgi:hypothetical protein